METRSANGSTSETKGFKTKTKVRVVVRGTRAEDTFRVEVFEHVLAEIVAVVIVVLLLYCYCCSGSGREGG